MASRKPNKPYYYAGGKRVALVHASDLVAVDDNRLAKKLPKLLASDAALRAGRRLRDGIRLVERHTLAPETVDSLVQAGVTQPVFRHDDSILVALPEVRVEDQSKAKLAKAKKYAAKTATPVADDEAGRLTLHPLSADGGDALTLANELVEQHDLTSVSPRFLRVVPGPAVRS